MGSNLTPSLKAKFPKFPPRNTAGEKPGGQIQRRAWMRWPSTASAPKFCMRRYGLRLYALEDAELQEACFQIANDWMIDYCQSSPGRLFGIPMISMYNIPNAIKELERCKKNGMVGCMIWQVPPEHLPFTSDYYNPFWEAASELDMPVNVHILTGFNYSRFERKGLDTYRMTVNQKLTDAANTLFDFVFGGAVGEISRS